MGRHSKPDPSNICKILNEDDCTSIMQIPSRLVKSYGETLPRVATLKIDESGKSWKVGIEKFKGHYFFTDGWEKFAKDVDVESREYLHFKSPSPLIHHHNTDSETGDLSGDSGSEETIAEEEEGGSWSFSRKLEKCHAYRLDVPKCFVRGTGIDTNRETKLVDGKGGRWPVRVTERGGKFSFGGGWNDFLVGNEVAVGSTISFEFVSIAHNMIIAQVVKVGTNEKELFQFVKMEEGGRFDLVDSHKTSYHTKHTRNSHLKVKARNKDHSSEPEENGSRVCRRWRFSKELKKHHAYLLEIPSDFAWGTRTTTNREVKLVDEGGREWPIDVEYRKNGVYAMVGGWKDFLVGNEAGVGSRISFKWMPTSSDNLIEAKVINNGRQKKSRFAKRGRGRPPLWS